LINLVVFNDEMTRFVDEGRVVDTFYLVFNKAFDNDLPQYPGIKVGMVLSTGQNNQMAEKTGWAVRLYG